LSGQPTTHPHWQSAFKELSVRTWVASSVWNKPDRYAHVRELILRGLAQGQLKPMIDKVFPLDQIAEAHRYLESNQQVGKVVVKP
jgi:NADPH:quinone reductase